MNNKKINVAFFGGGVNSAVGAVHKIALSMDSLYNLIGGVFSSRKDINVASAIEYGLDPSKAYQNIDELLESEKYIDAICILTPTSKHLEHIKYIHSFNIPIICEKSLCTSYSEGVFLDNHLLKTNFFTITYNYTGYPMVRELRNFIKIGEFGDICQINIQMPQESFSRITKDGKTPQPQKWRLSEYDIPCISLDLGIHLQSIIQFLLDDIPIEVLSLESTFGEFQSVIDNVIGLIKYKKGTTVNLWYGKSSLGKRNGLKLEVYGKKGSCSWNQEFPEYLHISNKNGSMSTIDRSNENLHIANKKRYNRFKAGHPSGFIEAFSNYYFDVAHFIKTGFNVDNFVFNFEDALLGIKILHLMHKSHLSKKWITVE